MTHRGMREYFSQLRAGLQRRIDRARGWLGHRYSPTNGIQILLLIFKIFVAVLTILFAFHQLAVSQGNVGLFFPDKHIDAAVIIPAPEGSTAGNSLSALNKEGLRIWKRPLPGVAKKAILIKEEQWIVVGLTTENREIKEQLVVYDKDGNSTPFDAGSSAQPPKDWVFAGRFSVQDIEYIPEQYGGPLLAVLLYDTPRFASGVEVYSLDFILKGLSFKDSFKGSYWNPGGLGDIEVVRLENKTVLVVRGLNNHFSPKANDIEPREYSSVFFALELDSIVQHYKQDQAAQLLAPYLDSPLPWWNSTLEPKWNDSYQLWYYFLWPRNTGLQRAVKDQVGEPTLKQIEAQGEKIDPSRRKPGDVIRLDTTSKLFYLVYRGFINKKGLGDAPVLGDAPGPVELLTVEQFWQRMLMLAQPYNLSASIVTPAQVNLSWNISEYNNSKELGEYRTGFRLQRAIDRGFTRSVTDFSIPTYMTMYVDTNITPSTTYYYRVFVTSNVGTSVPSDVVSVTIPYRFVAALQP